MSGGGNAGALRPVRRGLAGAILPAATVVVPLSILALIGWLQWRAVWDDAGVQMLRAADGVAEYGSRALESYRFAAGRVNDRLRGLTDQNLRDGEGPLHHELQRREAELTQGEQTQVFDRLGHVLVSSRQFPVPPDLTPADREGFDALAGPAPPAAHVGRTYTDPRDGRLLFSVTRRRSDTGNPVTPGTFDGTVEVAISPLVLADGMRRLLPVTTDFMALVRADGYGLSTTGALTDTSRPLPRVAPGSPYHRFADGGARSALYLSETAVPGTTALLAMRRLDGFPVYGVSLRVRADIAARWRHLMAPQLAVGVLATLGLLALSLRVAHDQRRLAAANATLRIGNDLSSDRLLRAKRFGLVGTFEHDFQTGISRRSPEYMSVHGLPAVAAEERHDDWVSRIHPDDRERAETHLRQALADGGGVGYAQTYRIVTQAGDVRWIAARGEIQRDAAGHARMLLGAHVDVTPLRTTELALAESDARLRLAQEAVGIGTWELSRTGPLVLSRHTRQLCGLPPETLSDPAHDAAAVLARMHPADRGRVRRELARARRSGRFRTEFRLLRPVPEGEAVTVWVAARARRLTDRSGLGDRLMGVAYDVTERKQAEAEAVLLAHEVEHRAKNMLTLVSALVRMTAGKDQREFADVVQGRIMALARSTSLLGQRRWQGADLRELIRQELAPFDAAEGEASRIAQSGPELLLTPEQAQPLGMALHELTTNAAKYGALSTPEGRLEVQWRIEGGRVHLDWRERGGPPSPASPPRSSFGSRLIQSALAEQLHGTVQRCWEADGLSLSVSFPWDGTRPSGPT